MESWHDRVKAILAEKGWSQAELARRADVDEQKLYKWLQGGVDNPRGDGLKRLAKALGRNFVWLREGIGPEHSSFPVVGRVGAGEQFIPFDENPKGFGYDTVEFSLDSADPIAVEVRGTSMLPVYRPGDLLLCSRYRGAEIGSCIGHDCIVMTENGEGYIKKLSKGSKSGLFTLLSYNDEPIVDAKIEWCAPVIWVKRGR